MAIIYQKFLPANYVMLMKKGKVVKEGLGLALWYDQRKVTVLQVPATANDEPFSFDDLITEDYQTACVQGQVTFRVTDFRQAVQMADFSFVRKGVDNGAAAIRMFGKRIVGLSKVILMKEVAGRGIRALIKDGDELADRILEELKGRKEIRDLGVEILAFNILCIAARPETRKALEAAAREEILKEQDDAIYLRRNAAIEQERLIKENELNTEIRVIEKEKERAEKEQEVKRRVMTAELEMKKERTDREAKIREAEMEGRLLLEEKESTGRMRIREQEMEEQIRLEERNRQYVVLETENENVRAMQRAEAARAMIQAYENVNVALIEACALAQMDPGALMAKAFLQMGENAGKIGTLNMTPDLLEAITGMAGKAGAGA